MSCCMPLPLEATRVQGPRAAPVALPSRLGTSLFSCLGSAKATAALPYPSRSRVLPHDAGRPWVRGYRGVCGGRGRTYLSHPLLPASHLCGQGIVRYIPFAPDRLDLRLQGGEVLWPSARSGVLRGYHSLSCSRHRCSGPLLQVLRSPDPAFQGTLCKSLKNLRQAPSIVS